MPSGLTNYGSNKVIDAILRGQSLGAPANLYVALIRATLGYSSSNRSTAVSVGATIVPATPNGRLYRCSTAGTTGSGEPTWPTTDGGTVTDGTAVWTEMTPDLKAFNSNVTAAEVSGGNYSRGSIACSLAAWSGTQGAGTTAASNGTTQQSSNNAQLTLGAPSANWGYVAAELLVDAATGGNAWYYTGYATPVQILNGQSAPYFAAGQVVVSHQ